LVFSPLDFAGDPARPSNETCRRMVYKLLYLIISGVVDLTPFERVRVLAAEQILAGPYCTQLLAAFGAEVIKVEPPGGEHARGNPPFLVSPCGERVSGYFSSLNRNKKSICLNLKHREAREIFCRLAAASDVVLANYRPGLLEKMGLGFPVLAGINPKLIYATISGFGYPEMGESPYWEWPAFDIVAQAMGGIMSVTGEAGKPTRVGVSVGDLAAGLFTAFGIVTALYWREKTGLGQWVDVSMVDAVLALLENPVMRYSFTGRVPEPVGNRHPSIAPFDSFEASDGYLVIAGGSSRTWEALCEAMGRGDLVSDPRFHTNEDRLKNYPALKETIQGWTMKHSRTYLVETLIKAGCPAGPVLSVDDIVNDRHFAERGMLSSVPIAGQNPLLANVPVKLSKARPELGQPPPQAGQHTREVLCDLLGLSEETLLDLTSRGIFGEPDGSSARKD